MDSKQILQAALTNDRTIFISTLRSLSLIDIGTIISVNKGRALVHGSSFVGGRQLVYQDAEIIFPGNNAGAYTVECANTPCLIFTPASCMPSTRNRKIRFSAVYDKAGVKVLPIGNGYNNAVTTKFDAEGTFSISSDKYSFRFRKDNMGLFRIDAACSFEVDNTGDIHISRQSDTLEYHVDITGAQIQTTYIQNDKQWLITAEKGQVSIQQKDANGQEVSSVVLDSTGKAIVNASSIELNGNDKSFVTYAELKAAMDKLWIAMTTTNIIGNGSPQPTWAGLDPVTGIDISAAETQTVKTGG